MNKFYTKKHLLFCCFFLLATIFACKKSNESTVTVKETSSFTYTINNVAATADSCTYVWYKESNNFYFNAYVNGYPKFYCVVSVPLATGTYTTPSTPMFFDYFPTISIVGYSVVGTVVISSIDPTTKIITGTFSGACTHGTTTDVFTNGKFTARSQY
jgi:hypothetical protein